MGCVIYNLGGNVLITNSNLTGNTAYSWGGTIYNYGTLKINNTNLTQNTAAYSGGAIYNYIYSNMNLTKSTLKNNKAIWGGAIFTYYASTNITNTNLKYNNAKTSGGAIDNTANLSITNSDITGNAAEWGATIYNNGNINKIENTTFSYNNPPNFIIEDNKIKLNKTDNFISVGKFTIIADEEEFHGRRSSDFEMYPIASTNKNVKIILNGTDTKTLDNTFILRKTNETDVTSYQALVDAIEEAKQNIYSMYKINLLSGDYNATQNIIWEDSDTRKIIINGNGYTLDGNNTYQFIQIAEDHDLTLENIKITKYATTMSGGAINNNGNLTVRNSNLTYNLAGNGGAIHNTGEYTISDTLFHNNNPVNFQINENNNIELINTDGFISINDFTIITDYEVYHGNGQEALEQYTISTDALNIKLLLNGTNTTDNTFIIKGNNEKINSQKTKITNENPISGSTTDITATFIIEDNPITEGMVIFRLNGKTLRDDDGKVIYVNINEGKATLKDVPITNTWAGDETTLQAIFAGNDEFEPLYTDKLIISVSKREAQIELTAPSTAQTGETITLSASVTSGGEPLTTGRVAFKLNGKTLKDKTGKALYVNVVNGNATTTYTLPAKIKANTYTLTAVFAENTYERCEKETQLKVNK